MKQILIFSVPILLALSLVYLPNFWVHFAVLVDFYSPWVLFNSTIFEKYHNLSISRLQDREEIPLLEIDHSEASYNNVLKLTKKFTWPIVIRGLLENSTAINQWKDSEFWMQHYADEEMICGVLDLIEDCNVALFFRELKAGRPFYISGASGIFENHPELHAMIDNEQIRSLEPGQHRATQVFMGVPDMGSDIHCAMGVNM